jgi:hypothetical protein
MPAAAACVLLTLSAALVGCGYPGEPLPPALNRPVRATELTALQRGSEIVVQFTVPEVTTENLPLRGEPDIELRIGPMPAGTFSIENWANGAQRVSESAIHTEEIQPPAPANEAAKKKAEKKKTNPKRRSAPIQAVQLHVTARVDASKLYGKTVVIGVRVHGPRGQDIGWSRLETLQLVPALPVPSALAATNAPDAIRLDWHAAAPEFRIFRKMPADPAFQQIGTSDKPSYVDSTIDYGKTYEYLVESIEKAGEHYAESEPSASVTFTPKDTFPPAVPGGLSAVPGARSIELVWDRNAERDFASYQVFRDGKKIAEGLTAPAYSDRDVKPGTRYRYQVLAIDTAGNASALSAPVETAIP